MNDNILKWFDLLIKYLEYQISAQKVNTLIYSYKVNAIKKAFYIIKNIKHKITSGKQLMEYKHIGPKIAQRVDEILQTGKLSEVELDKIKDRTTYINELMKIFGIGKVKALELITKNDITSIEDLKKANKKGTIKLSSIISKGLQYVDQIDIKIPRSEMNDINLYLINVGIELDPEMEVRVCGSFRREKDYSGDIDVIVSHYNKDATNIMLDYLELLKKKKFIIDSFTSEKIKTKYMGLCQLKPKLPLRRIDIRYIPYESYYTAIMYFTGSSEFNKKMRLIANGFNYKLNEYELIYKSKPNKKIYVNSEMEIFKLLNMEYVQPINRN